MFCVSLHRALYAPCRTMCVSECAQVIECLCCCCSSFPFSSFLFFTFLRFSLHCSRIIFPPVECCSLARIICTSCSSSSVCVYMPFYDRLLHSVITLSSSYSLCMHCYTHYFHLLWMIIFYLFIHLNNNKCSSALRTFTGAYLELSTNNLTSDVRVKCKCKLADARFHTHRHTHTLTWPIYYIMKRNKNETTINTQNAQ